MITVYLSAALLCISSACFPVLVGKHTPTGTFDTYRLETDDVGYGGDIMPFHETPTEIYAIHRVWLLNPAQRRPQRLRSSNPKDRVITAGCINVSPEVYDKLRDCCIPGKLTIIP